MQKQIAVLPGDGIGPEVTEQALKILDAVSERFDQSFDYRYGTIGAAALKNSGTPLPEATLELCKRSDAVLLGATGHPYYDTHPSANPRPEDGLLTLRKALGLYANIRPVQIFPELIHLSPLKTEKLDADSVDLVIVRELISGLYFGEKGRAEDGKSAFDHCNYTVEEIEPVARLAFEEASRRKGRLVLVDKANVLETSRLWREVVLALQADYPAVEVACYHAERMAMELILQPGRFDVLLTANMIGDMLSEEAAILTGSLGLLPSASIGRSTSLYEPVHGAWPKAAGKNKANPIGAILSASMMLKGFGLVEAAQVVRLAVEEVLKKGLGTPDLRPGIPCDCSQLGDLIAHMVLDEDRVRLKSDRILQRVSTII